MTRTKLIQTDGALKKRKASVKLSDMKNRERMFCYLFILPQGVLYLLFTLWPILASYYFAFFNWTGIGWPTKFIGFQNFKEVLVEPFFWNAFKNSFIYTFSLVLLVVPTSLIVAMILNNPRLRAAAFFRTVFFLPIVLTMAIVGIVMTSIFAYEGGLINQALMQMGWIDKQINWLGQTGTAMTALILVGAWKGFGIKVIYWLAGLQTLPAELYEAARIDGANGIQRFFHLTIPLLIPFLIIITFFQTVWAFNVFDLVKTFTNGGPYFGTDVVPLYIYRNAFEIDGGLPRMGYASAAGIIYGIATMVISIILGLLVRKYGGKRVYH
jgi:ABC-type sugar transport system permease subunit